ncbi:MAG: tRNA (adenosine(37)-N6)-threonylcarbamoyltransferase complex ATPase subunit type 1 TsaE [Clostridia bacterium]|nr:tRNA (adenosine(37)-N6)-threonylcarbamoyltransferase complex ATPase subunit type 1 TsaE [Clostridia bacterium]
MAIYLSGSERATINFAKQYAQTLVPGDVVLLDGEMGAGKTVFTKGIALGLGIEDEILSPTYTYMNDYSGVLYHYDCSRLTSGAQAEALGLLDYMGKSGICVIEWAENIADVLPANYKRVTIIKLSTVNREIICE